MIMTNKLLPVALVAALIGGSVGAFVMHSKNQNAEPQTTASVPQNTDPQYAQYQANAPGAGQFAPAEFSSSAEQTAYKSGFADGFRACESGAAGLQSGNQVGNQVVVPQRRVVYRNAGSSSSSARRVYYDYQKPKGRSFWSKHRDKLTVAMGTGGGALIGGLIGGKKGAAIGALSGAGGSALYTYKLRNRNKRY
ncbi:MAG TPA: hypothetical protein VGC61_04235 [Pyrinomonadaceae bacterium]